MKQISSTYHCDQQSSIATKLQSKLLNTLFIFLIFIFGINKVSTLKNSLHVVKTNSTLDKTILIIQYRAPYLNPYRSNPQSYNDSVAKGNWGDWVWKYAAHYLLDNSNSQTCMLSREDCLDKHPGLQSVIHYHPFANDLRAVGTSLRRHDIQIELAGKTIASFNEAFLPLGIGTQLEFSKRPHKQNIGIGSDIYDAADTLELESNASMFLNALQRKKYVSFFRGSFTNRVAIKHGYTYGLESGCPSLFISKHTSLGALLQTGYEKVSKRIGDKSLKVAFNSSPRSPRFMKLFAKLLMQYPNSLMFVQEKIEMNALRDLGIPFNRLRMFEGDIVAWFNALSEMDVAFGARIHGNMAAISASSPIPVFIIAPDYRVLELASVMKIPNTHIYDERLRRENVDIAQMIRDSHFNGRKFDENRCRLSKMYVSVFSKYGLNIAPHVRKISLQC